MTEPTLNPIPDLTPKLDSNIKSLASTASNHLLRMSAPINNVHRTPGKDEHDSPEAKARTSFTEKIKNNLEKMHPSSRSSTSSSNEIEMKSIRSSSSSTRSCSPPRSRTAPKASKPKSKPKPKAQSGTFSDVGRHSNQWLFNNLSITDAVKTLLER
ncbi:hypothetical protein AC579_2205 [Pseudocercospora musae]|uniref:Uncharacterized protein n=1 Tax=Pseudocercospora musae TaxID=113226 RepID=A0A139IL74_9PEZI|nr:hypothetical protein AC579_2205 [Pseudocercospora musae]